MVANRVIREIFLGDVGYKKKGGQLQGYGEIHGSQSENGRYKLPVGGREEPHGIPQIPDSI